MSTPFDPHHLSSDSAPLGRTRRLRSATRHRLGAAALVASAIAIPFACVPSGSSKTPGTTPPGSEGSPEPEFGELDQSLTSVRGSVWPKTSIPVCWENFGPAYDTHRGWVREAVRNTWEAHSAIDFTGWGACGSGSDGIRIGQGDGTPHVVALGSDLDGVRNGVYLNFNYDYPECGGHKNCIELHAVHEFGHALGFAHEENRIDAPLWCQDLAQGSDGDVPLTPYDADSIMNYCRPEWTRPPELSALDIAGLEFWYGPEPSSGIPWEPSCKDTVVLFEHVGYGGDKLPVSGNLTQLSPFSFNDKPSSFCVPAGIEVTLFQDAGYEGFSETFVGPTRLLDLTIPTEAGITWNGSVSAIKLKDLTTNEELVDLPPECDNNVVLYEDSFFRGLKLVDPGSIDDLGAINWNDSISSFCIPEGVTIQLAEHDDYGGKRLLYHGPWHNQNLKAAGSGWWNDKISSVRY